MTVLGSVLHLNVLWCIQFKIHKYKNPNQWNCNHSCFKTAIVKKYTIQRNVFTTFIKNYETAITNIKEHFNLIWKVALCKRFMTLTLITSIFLLTYTWYNLIIYYKIV